MGPYCSPGQADEWWDKDRRLNVARLHASILGIIIAATVSYVFIERRHIEELEAAAIIKANGLNRVPLPVLVSGDQSIAGDGSDSKVREDRLDYLYQLANPAEPNLAPDEMRKRGLDFVRTLGALLSCYPFHPIQRNVDFTTLPEVRRWSTDIDHFLFKLGWRRRSWEPPGMYELTSAYRAERLINAYTGADTPGEHDSSLRATIAQNSHVVDSQEQAIAKTTEVANDVRERLDAYDAYIKSRPYWISRALFLLLAGLAFVCGVAVPLLCDAVARSVFLYVPLGVYALIFCNAVYVIMACDAATAGSAR
jgi:hypothetical protein